MDSTKNPESPKLETISRREALKRIAKGAALVGTLGVTAVVTQGQDECSGGYANSYRNFYYNYYDVYFYDDFFDYYNFDRHERPDWDDRHNENEENEERDEREKREHGH